MAKSLKITHVHESSQKQRQYISPALTLLLTMEWNGRIGKWTWASVGNGYKGSFHDRKGENHFKQSFQENLRWILDDNFE